MKFNKHDLLLLRNCRICRGNKIMFRRFKRIWEWRTGVKFSKRNGNADDWEYFAADHLLDLLKEMKVDGFIIARKLAEYLSPKSMYALDLKGFTHAQKVICCLRNHICTMKWEDTGMKREEFGAYWRNPDSSYNVGVMQARLERKKIKDSEKDVI